MTFQYAAVEDRHKNGQEQTPVVGFHSVRIQFKNP